MSNHFQRDGSISNSHVGRHFEDRARKALATCGLQLNPAHKVPCGLGTVRKNHSFDLGSEDPRVIVECKSHTWTSGGNVPSAKMKNWAEAMFYFHMAPRDYRKIFGFLTQMCARFSPQQVSHAVERGCGCARSRESAVKSAIAQSTAACAGPAFGGGPARRQPVPPQVAEALAFTGQRTMNTRGTRPGLSPTFYRWPTLADCSAPWNWQAPRDFRRVPWAGLSESLQFLSRYRRCSPAT